VGYRRRSWLIASVTAVALIIILAVTLGAHIVRSRTAKPAITSIAVLPLDNLTGDPAQNYLADGLTDELTTQLARDSTLRIISRTSVMQYKGAHRPLPEIARALNVDGVIEGSLSRSGNLLHMTVQLIQAPTDTHLWADSYDRDPTDLVTLPQEAALTIAKQTHSSVAAAAPRYVSPAAHDAYLRGRYLWFSGHDRQSAPYFIKATQLQPDYALAWTGVATYYAAGAVARELDPRQALPLARQAALKSIQLDPTLPEAHLVLASNYWLDDWNFDAAIAELDKALQLDPKYSEAWHLRSKLLIQDNRFDEGLEAQRRAMEINPFESPWAMTHALLMTRHFDAAIAEAQQRIAANADNAPTYWMLSEAYRGKGMHRESEQAFEHFLALARNPSAAEAVHRAYARGGPRAVLQWRIDDLKTLAKKGYVSPFQFALFYAELGDKQQALASLDEGLRQRSPALFDIQNDTSFDALHADPRYRAIVQKIGLPPAW
jgi:TolB-like protein